MHGQQALGIRECLGSTIHRCYRSAIVGTSGAFFKSLAYKKSSNKFCRLKNLGCRQHRCSQPGPGCSGLRFAPVPGYAALPFASCSPSAGEYILGWPVFCRTIIHRKERILIYQRYVTGSYTARKNSTYPHELITVCKSAELPSVFTFILKIVTIKNHQNTYICFLWASSALPAA